MSKAVAGTILDLVSDQVVRVDPDGKYDFPIHIISHQLPDMLSVADGVRMVGRVRKVRERIAEPVDRDGLSFEPLPFYQGLRAFLTTFPGLLVAIWKASGSGHAALVRLPSTIGLLYALCMIVRRRPYGVQLIGDAAELSRVKTLPTSSRLALRLLSAMTRLVVARASTAAYVTDASLQCEYPAREVPTFAFSNINLPGDRCAAQVRTFDGGRLRLSFVGTLEFDYKGLGDLLDAMAILKECGVDVHLDIMGEGVLRERFEQQATALGLTSVHFHGRVPQAEVLERHRANHVFVLPSYTEGLPRALIEAMAQGMPAVATDVAGNGELLDPHFIVPVREPEAIAQRLRQLAETPTLFAEQAARNLARAGDFVESRIAPLRRDFYATIIQQHDASRRGDRG
ncbi:glycosyltransferase [Sphingomicrobium arenosum]|uniref:glycosyltransferase n=1 Tax=Sphingomicrobium arenosum TaxID=2233861 RepID=UPI00223F048F|nr:glycosyltransferase [Sphingomicrobium arenosum]